MAATTRRIITDTLTVKKTGKTLEACYLLLDKLGAKKLTQEKIYALAAAESHLAPLGEWNLNLLATSYMWSRGLKDRGERKDGYEVSVSKTISVPVSALYASFVDDSQRRKWLSKKITIRKATENKSVRVTWNEDETSLSIDFYAKGPEKSQITVQHQKIKTVSDRERQQLFWTDALENLKHLLIR